MFLPPLLTLLAYPGESKVLMFDRDGRLLSSFVAQVKESHQVAHNVRGKQRKEGRKEEEEKKKKKMMMMMMMMTSKKRKKRRRRRKERRRLKKTGWRP